ncbi:hypothetical protein BJ165DRAFT_1427502 [Panaeolus papilionaceus]|nr:hypothetical protein BJ165DRAFT_1427502 [Panaeolus papilionaceus]
MSASESEARTIPSQDIIEKAAELEIYDVNGTKLKFGSLFEDKKVVVVFIRHFYCSSCQDYAAHLARIPKEALDNAGTQIVLIGSGDFQPIKFYAETTSFPGPIYANPSRSLFKLFGMTYSTQRTPSGETKKEYAKDAMPVWKSFFKALYVSGKRLGLPLFCSFLSLY